MSSDRSALANVCALYSATGIIFMSWVGIMLMKQPFFIGGIDDVKVAKGSAFGAAGMFLFIFLASMYVVIVDSRRSAVYDSGRTRSEPNNHLSRPSWMISPARGEYSQVSTSEFNFSEPESNIDRGLLT